MCGIHIQDIPQIPLLVTSHNLPIDASLVISQLCSACQLEKGKKLPFQESQRISDSPFHLIHSNV
jgi:hypothetical protein